MKRYLTKLGVIDERYLDDLKVVLKGIKITH